MEVVSAGGEGGVRAPRPALVYQQVRHVLVRGRGGHGRGRGRGHGHVPLRELESAGLGVAGAEAAPEGGAEPLLAAVGVRGRGGGERGLRPPGLQLGEGGGGGGGGPGHAVGGAVAVGGRPGGLASTDGGHWRRAVAGTQSGLVRATEHRAVTHRHQHTFLCEQRRGAGGGYVGGIGDGDRGGGVVCGG